MDEHIFQAPLGGKVDDSRDKLATDDFDLMMRQIMDDVEVYEVWKRKCSTVVGSRYYKEQETLGTYFYYAMALLI